MKSIIYIELVLIFFCGTIVFSGQFNSYSDSARSTQTVDTSASARRMSIIDSLKKMKARSLRAEKADTASSAMHGKHVSTIDSLNLKPDSSGAVKVDTIKIDSVRIRFIPGMGQFASDIDSIGPLAQKQFLWSDAKYPGDLFWKLPGFFWRDLGEAGKWGELYAFGLDGRYIDVMLDGRPMNDPVTGTYNFYDMPLEFIDHVEILAGSSANIAAGQQGVALNFISRSYNSFRPMTKLRFVQDPKGNLLTDGIYTQNIARGLNLMIGFMRQSSQGNYFQVDLNRNIIPTLDAWNIRTRLRYNITDRLNVSLTDFYTKAVNGLNGGLDVSQSADIFEPSRALVANQLSFDKRSRHDVTLSAIARLFPDSSSTTQADVYYSELEREYWNPPDYRIRFRNIDDSTKSSFWGMRLQQQISLPLLHLVAGGQWEKRRSDSTRTIPAYVETEKSLFVQAELRLINIIVPSVTLRSISINGINTLNSGFGFRSEIGNYLKLFADASWFDRFPTIQERYQIDSTIIRSGGGILKEQHAFFQAGFNLDIGSNVLIGLTGYQREVKNAIVYLSTTTGYGYPAIGISSVDEVKLSGINGSIILRLYNFEVAGIATLTRYKQSDTIKTPSPDIILGGELSYRDKFFDEKLEAKFGVRSRFYNRQQGMQFDPQILSYFQYSGGIIGRSTTLDLFMVLRIGDAQLSFSWNNILGADYILSPIYPMPGRNIRVGVNWVFMD